MTQKNANKVAGVIRETVGTDKASWKQIVAAVEAAGVKVTNWLDVRGVLQWLINEGEIARVDSVFVEEYVPAA